MNDSDDTPDRTQLAKYFAACILVALGTIIFVDGDEVARLSGFNALTDSATELIDSSMLSNQKTFLMFSAIKASLALIEGSTVGVGVEVQVGDLIQPAYDYVDFFWKVFLFAFVILGFYKILLETGLLTLGFPLIAAGCLLMAVSLAVSHKTFNMTLLARKLILIGVLVCYVLPLSLLASDGLSKRYVNTLKEQHHASITQFHAELDETQEQFLAVKQQLSILHPSESLDHLRDGMVVFMQEVSETFQVTLLSFMYFVLIMLFELLVLPFCTAIVLYLVGRRILRGIGSPPIPVVEVIAPKSAVA
jgi:hypothetical protein